MLLSQYMFTCGRNEMGRCPWIRSERDELEGDNDPLLLAEVVRPITLIGIGPDPWYEGWLRDTRMLSRAVVSILRIGKHVRRLREKSEGGE